MGTGSLLRKKTRSRNNALPTWSWPATASSSTQPATAIATCWLSEQRFVGCSSLDFAEYALRGALAIGELDEIDLEDNTPAGDAWTARFAGVVGLGLVQAYELEMRCNWSGAIVHPTLVEHLDSTVLSEHEDGVFTALDQASFGQLLLETSVPVKNQTPGGKMQIVYRPGWVIYWPFLNRSPEWAITEDQVAASFTSYGRTASACVKAKRDETLAFMRRADADSATTLEQRRRSGLDA